MANLVIASNSKAMSKLDGSIKKKVFDFFEKLSEDDTSPSLHIEPLHVATDPRVRTGRVDLHYRAVLFKVEDKSNTATYIYMGTWNHDDAIKLAEKATLRVNPINGTLEGLIESAPAAESVPQVPVAPPIAKDETPYLAGVGYSLERPHGRARHRTRSRRKGDGGYRQIAVLDAAEGALGPEQSALLELVTRTTSRPSERSTASPENLSTPTLMTTQRSSRRWNGQRPRCSSPTSRTTRSCGGSSRAATSPPGGSSSTPNNANMSTPISAARSGCPAEQVPARPWWQSTGRASSPGEPQCADHSHHVQRDARPEGLKADLEALDPALTIAEKPGDGVYVGGIDALGRDVHNRAAREIALAASEAVFGRSGLDSSSGRRERMAMRSGVRSHSPLAPDSMPSCQPRRSWRPNTSPWCWRCVGSRR